MVYGDCYAADEQTYQKVEEKIRFSVANSDDLEVNLDTNELSGIKNVDPLNITYLRVRGMWIIENPTKVYDYLYSYDKNATFQLIALMRKTKYKTFSSENRLSLEEIEDLEIKDVRIKNPNNPANLIDAKLLIYKVM